MKIVANYIYLKDQVLRSVIVLDWSLKFFDLFDCQLFLLIKDFVVDVVMKIDCYMLLVVDYNDGYYVNYEVMGKVRVDEKKRE